MRKIKVLFVCMGNICRSPTAEAVFVTLLAAENKTEQFEVDSAGTHAYHIGEAPDLRAQQAAQKRGINLAHIVSRKVVLGDFDYFDYLLVMDDDNYQILIQTCPEQYRDKIHYLLDFAPQLGTREVPDPYYGGKYGFERVLDMVETAAIGFLNKLKTSGEVK